MISDNKLYLFIYFRMSSVAPAYVNTRGRAYQCSRCGDAVVDSGRANFLGGQGATALSGHLRRAILFQ